MRKIAKSDIKTHSTRYRGSKRKIIDWLLTNIEYLEYESVLDAFGGSGVVSYMFKNIGKKVTYNDSLKFNHYIGKSLIENDFINVTEREIDELVKTCKSKKYPDFIQKTFPDIFYLEEENKWLDSIIYNINSLWSENERYKKEIAFNALFQSCLVKRPFNLFHRKNLNIRTASVTRTFGNKSSWDSSFELQFRKFINEINSFVFSNGTECKALNEDIFHFNNTNFDLVYIDPPYLNSIGNDESINYLSMYHFLEGISHYNDWQHKINWNTQNRSFKHDNNANYFTKPHIEMSFCRMIEKFKNSTLVISYKSDGFPTIEYITEILYSYKNDVSVKTIDYKYALNKKSKKDSKEVLFIAK